MMRGCGLWECIVGNRRTNTTTGRPIIGASNHTVMKGRQKDGKVNQDAKTSHGSEAKKKGWKNERQKVCEPRLKVASTGIK